MSENAMRLMEESKNGALSVFARLPSYVEPAGRGPADDVFLTSFDPVPQNADGDLALRFDNFHYPMGRAFYRLGALGIAEEAERSAAKPGKTDGQKANLVAIAEVWRAFAAYIARRADSININGETDRMRAENLRVLSKEPPRTFIQAAQLMYFCFCARNLCRCSCIGRLDTALSPFYLADKAAGRIDRDTASRVMLELWAKLNRWGSGDTLMNVMVGGMNPDGSDASTELTVIILEVSEKAEREFAMTEPHINVRWHKNIMPEVMRAACALQYLGGGQATLYNDDALIPEMLRRGIPAGIACDYANDGCTEIVYDSHGRIDFNHIDAVAALELALFNGQYADNPAKRPIGYFAACNRPVMDNADVLTGFESGDTDECGSFDELYDMFLRQYQYQLLRKLEELRDRDRTCKAGNLEGLPFLNGSFDHVLESGVGCTEGGLPMDSYMVFAGSIPTVADGLAALKYVVYGGDNGEGERFCTLAEVKAAMERNYSSPRDEELRRRLLAAPKFGNDDDRVDLIAADLARRICDYTERFCARNNSFITVALVGWRFLEEAYRTAAGCDGRKYGDAIAEHFCATPGRAKNGATAIMRSAAKAPLDRALGVSAMHISLSRTFFTDREDGIKLLGSICAAGLEMGLPQFNIAIYDTAKLREAQKHPELYSDLIVRVWGFSARFVELNREMQEHIIARTLQA